MKTKAHVTSSISNGSGAHKVTLKSMYVEIPAGDASVTVTHGFKDWFSDKFCGKTVESTCTVTISCKNSTKSIHEANKIASRLAYTVSIANGEKVQKDLEAFADEEMSET